MRLFPNLKKTNKQIKKPQKEHKTEGERIKKTKTWTSPLLKQR